VVLTGWDDEGSSGVGAVRAAGGLVITEDPAGAQGAPASYEAAERRPANQVLVAYAVADAVLRWLGDLDAIG
jgi:chemotaxis response regulator CheB